MRMFKIILLVLMCAIITSARGKTTIVCEDTYNDNSQEIVLVIKRNTVNVYYNGENRIFFIRNQNEYNKNEIWNINLRNGDNMLTYIIDAKNKKFTISIDLQTVFVHNIKRII